MFLISKLMIFAFIFGGSSEPATMEGSDGARSGQSASAPLVSLTNQRWALPLDVALVGSPSAGRGMLVATLADGEIFAVERASGAPVWSASGGYEGTPVVDGAARRVYATARGKIVCLDLSNGDVIWEQKSASQKHQAPALVDETLYVAGEDGRVVALRGCDGAVLWQVRSGVSRLAGSAPLVVGDRLFLASVHGDVAALSILDGKRLWKVGRLGKITGCTADEARLYCLADSKKLIALDSESGKVAWRVPLSSAVTEVPALSSGALYVAGRGVVVAHDAQTGDVLWASSTYSRSQLSRPVIAGEILYTGSAEGTLFALLTDGGAPRWRYDVGGKNVGGILVHEGQVYGSAGKMLFGME